MGIVSHKGETVPALPRPLVHATVDIVGPADFEENAVFVGRVGGAGRPSGCARSRALLWLLDGELAEHVCGAAVLVRPG